MALFIDSLKKSDRHPSYPVTVGIIGSRKLNPEETFIWEPLSPYLTIYGFDADEEACEIANQAVYNQGLPWQEQHFPYAIGKSTGEAPLYITEGVHCSSLYAPNKDYVSRFLGMREGFSLNCTIDLPTITLDDLVETENLQPFDFLQIDVQGADLDVLQGATKSLQSSIVGLEIEVEFTPLYKDQPLFGEIDEFLREQGFILFDILTDDGWCRRPRAISPIFSSRRGGQLLWGNAFYFRDPLVENAHPVAKNPDNIVKLACIADVLGYPDYALELFEYLTVNHGQDSPYNLANEIISILSLFPNLVEKGLENLEIYPKIRPFLTNP